MYATERTPNFACQMFHILVLNAFDLFKKQEKTLLFIESVLLSSWCSKGDQHYDQGQSPCDRFCQLSYMN